MARFRNAVEAHAELLKRDPECPVSVYFIRQLMLKRPDLCLRAGRLRFIDLDKLEKYFDEPAAVPAPLADGGKIRRIQ